VKGGQGRRLGTRGAGGKAQRQAPCSTRVVHEDVLHGVDLVEVSHVEAHSPEGWTDDGAGLGESCLCAGYRNTNRVLRSRSWYRCRRNQVGRHTVARSASGADWWWKQGRGDGGG